MNAEIFFYKIRKNINKLIDRIIYRYKLSFLFKPIKTELLILDDFFPCPLSNFRYVEFNEYLRRYNSVVLTTGKSISIVGEYRNIRKFIKIHPRKKQIKLFRAQKITEASQLTTNKIRGAIQFSHAYLALDPDARLIANEIISDITATARQYINLPFLSHNEHLEPLGNDSSKGPIVDDSYDGS